MSADQELVLIFGALHLMALVFGGLLMAMFLRSEALPAWRPPEEDEGEDDDGGGRGDGPASPTPPGGLPLRRSQPASARLREPGRLADAHTFPIRRPEHAPQRERERETEPA